MVADASDADGRPTAEHQPSSLKSRRHHAIEREQRNQALATLESQGELSDEQRAVVTALARRIVTTVGPAAIATVRTTDERDEE